MRVFHPAPILPSNAPPWAGVENSDHYSQLGSFQDQRGDKHEAFLPSQHYAPVDGSDDASDDDEKFSVPAVLDRQMGHGNMAYIPSHATEYTQTTLPDENMYSSILALEHQYDIQRSQLLQNNRHLDDANQARTERKLEATARWLAESFALCDGYVKYRQRQPKSTKKKMDQIWPDHMETAFLRGQSW